MGFIVKTAVVLNVTCLCTVFRIRSVVYRKEKKKEKKNSVKGGNHQLIDFFFIIVVFIFYFCVFWYEKKKKPRKRPVLHTLSGKLFFPCPSLPLELNHIVHLFYFYFFYFVSMCLFVV